MPKHKDDLDKNLLGLAPELDEAAHYWLSAAFHYKRRKVRISINVNDRSYLLASRREAITTVLDYAGYPSPGSFHYRNFLALLGWDGKPPCRKT